MLNEKVSLLLNTQINKEFYSAYLYLHFSNFYVEQGLNGFANWYQIQAQEERSCDVDAPIYAEQRRCRNL